MSAKLLYYKRGDDTLDVDLLKRTKVAEDMSKAEFDAVMEKGLQQAKEGKTKRVKTVFKELRQEVG